VSQGEGHCVKHSWQAWFHVMVSVLSTDECKALDSIKGHVDSQAVRAWHKVSCFVLL
jgi:hypothetical protein